MADGKVVIETDLDSSGIEKGLSKLGKVASTGLKAATVAISGTSVALGGVATAAVKTGSDFEKQMSRVQAISGATGEDFEKLRDQAIQLGADTSFSASSAAEGMENLAAAGFEVNEITEAMPGLLALAAASGEDLAVSSDIAASAIRGFGLDAEDAAHVADVLAANANKTNSSVSETGEALKYIAPLAQAAGIEFEETAAAIGIMANAGIQGSQAGTTLRAALSRLSKPTSDMQEVMDELGISFYDSEGKMKSLSEQVGMLQKATEGMTDEQRNNYLVTLYGQEALSGMLALINAGEGSLQELTAAYENSDGAAQAAADTMQDNLAGAMEQLGGSAETLGIVFYDSVSDNLKAAAESATDSVNEITEAFQDGGLDAAIEAAGDEFADLAVEVADHAPEMVDAAVDFVDSFGKGIKKNKKKLIKAAGDMAETMAGGLAKLLPYELEEPVKDAIDAVAESLNSGGLKKGADTFRRTIDTAIDVVGELADVALPVLTESLDFVGNNLDWIVPVLGGATAAWGTYKVATTAAATANKVATAAQTALNLVMNANPVILVGSALAAAATGLALYAANANQASEEQLKFEQEMDVLNSKIQENKTNLDQLSQSMEENYASIEASGAPLERLKGKLDEVFDSSGKVKEGNEKVAQSILNDLNEAMGTSYTLTADGFIANNNEVVGSLDDVKESIDEYIQKLKEKSLGEASSDQYTKAIQEQAEAQDNLTEAQKKYNEALDAYAEINAAGWDLLALGEAQENLSKTRDALIEAAEAAGQADQNIESLDNVMDLLANGNIQEAMDAYGQLPIEVEKAGNSISTVTDTIQAALDSQDYTKMIEGFGLAALEIEKSGGEIPKSLQKSLKGAVEEFNKLSPTAQAAAISLMQDMMDGMSEKIPDFENVSQMSAEKVLETFRDYLVNSGALKGIGIESTSDLAMSINEGMDMVQQQSSDGTQAVIKGMSAQLQNGAPYLRTTAKNTAGQISGGFTESDFVHAMVTAAADACGMTQAEFISHYPEMNSVARQLAASGATGFTAADLKAIFGSDTEQAVMAANQVLWGGAGQLQESSYQMAANAGTSFASADLSGSFSGETSKAASGAADELVKGSVVIAGAAAGLSAAATTALKNSDLKKTGVSEGKNLGAGIKQGVTSQNSSVKSTVVNLGKQAITALKGVKLQTAANTEGKNLGKGLKDGIASMDSAVRSAAIQIAKKAEEGIKNANLQSAGETEGKKLGNGLVSGIGGKSSSAYSEGSSLGRSARRGLESVDLHGAGYGQGVNFSSGLASGIRAGRSGAVSAAAEVASAALAASKKRLDINSPSGETEEQGRFFDKGYIVGIKKDTRKVEKSVATLNEKMLKAVDLRAISDRMRNVMDMNVSRVAAAHYESRPYRFYHPEEKQAAEVKQTINFYQPTPSPIQVSRALKKEARRLAFQ
ncbi:MAG: phage tail tape measure protein [Ruminococcus sp.]